MGSDGKKAGACPSYSGLLKRKVKRKITDELARFLARLARRSIRKLPQMQPGTSFRKKTMESTDGGRKGKGTLCRTMIHGAAVKTTILLLLSYPGGGGSQEVAIKNSNLRSLSPGIGEAAHAFNNENKKKGRGNEAF